MISYLLGIVAGIATPTQTSVNGRLREKIGSAYLTSVVSFAGAMLIMLVIVVAGGEITSVPFHKAVSAPFWIWGGGFCGAAIVMLNIICLPKLGSAKTVMYLSFGQIMTSLLIDHFGFFRVPIIEITLVRVIGAFIVLVGVIIMSYNWTVIKSKDKENNAELDVVISEEENGKANLIYVAGAIICGACCALQVAINGTLRTLIDSGTSTTLISMTVGFAVMSVLSAIIFIFKGKSGVFNSPRGDFKFRLWMLTGGVFAIIIVLSNSITAPVLGAGMVTVMNLIGQMSGGLFYDAVGFLGIQKRPVRLYKVVGMSVIVGGAAIIMLL